MNTKIAFAMKADSIISIYTSIDGDKQEKKEAESNIQVDKVELVL